MAETVVWEIDSTASYVRLNIPDQLLPITDPPIPAGFRDYSGPYFSPPAAEWTDDGGRRSFVEGEISTEYSEGVSLQFISGSHSASAIEFGSFRPDPTTWDGSNYDPDNEGAPASFGASLIFRDSKTGVPLFVAGFVAIRDVFYDFDGAVALSQAGSDWIGTESFQAGVAAGAKAHGQTFAGSFNETLDDTEMTENVGGLTVVNEGGNLRRLILVLDIPVQITIGSGKAAVDLEASATGVIVATAKITSSPAAQVVASYVSHSSFSGAGTPPDNRIDTGKVVAKEGSGPTVMGYHNLINTSQGINGLVFDIQDLLSESLAPEDFIVQVSPEDIFDASADYALWNAGPPPSSVTVTPGSPARVSLQWSNNAIKNRWLRLTIKAENTGLAADETYYIGHLLGETTGLGGTFYAVSFADVVPIRGTIGQDVDASSTTDIDKSGSVAFADVAAMRSNIGKELSNITIP